MKMFAVLLSFLVSFQSAWHLGSGDELKKVKAEVVGQVDCFDCAAKKIFPREAFTGIGVAIYCKGTDKQFRTTAVGILNGEGKFWVSLPREIFLENGTLKEECFACLHSASKTPCPPLDGIKAAKIVLKSKIDEKYTFGPAGELKLSPAICASAFFSWPHFRHTNIPWFPPRPKFPPFAKHRYVLSDYLPHPSKKKEKPHLPKISINRKPLPLAAPITLAPKASPGSSSQTRITGEETRHDGN